MLQAIPRYPVKIDAAGIQKRLEEQGFSIHRRSIERDLKRLSDEGIFPIEADVQSRPYGWYWPANVKPMDIPSMDPLTALSYVLIEQHAQDLLPSSITENIKAYFSQAHAILKKAKGRKKLGLWPDKVRLLDRGPIQQIPKIDEEIQRVIHNALLQNSRLHAIYLTRNKQEPDEYDVNPLGLVYKSGVAYLVCTLWDYEDIRQLALHRFIEAWGSEKISHIPKDFNLDTYIKKGEFGYTRNQKHIRLKALVKDYVAFHLAERPLADDQKLKQVKNSWYELQATVSDTEELRWWLLGYGDAIRVKQPISIRNEIVSTAKSIIDLYKKKLSTN